MVISLNYCSQNGGNLCRAPYYNGNPNIGIIRNLDQYPYRVQDLGCEMSCSCFSDQCWAWKAWERSVSFFLHTAALLQTYVHEWSGWQPRANGVGLDLMEWFSIWERSQTIGTQRHGVHQATTNHAAKVRGGN